MILVVGTSPTTQMTIHYTAVYGDGDFPVFRISPIWLSLWMGVWVLLIGLCCVSTCWLMRNRRRARMRGLLHEAGVRPPALLPARPHLLPAPDRPPLLLPSFSARRRT